MTGAQDSGGAPVCRVVVSDISGRKLAELADKRAEAALRQAYDELEQRVAERTEELRQANDELRTKITERKLAEEKLVASLEEKEILLREVHHRVKNNLAAIIALLDMQRKALGNPAASTALANIANRIASMALVHERLYQSENLSQIDFQEYLSALVSHLRTSLNAPRDLRCSVNAKGIGMGLDGAVPVGMIVNELVVNAMKYAFPDNKPRPGARQCELTIALERKASTITLIVADNGVGLPESIDWDTTSTLGLRLVKMLGEHQLGGTVDLDRSDGTRFTLQFKAT
jgi:two-component sensor histidine kinase